MTYYEEKTGESFESTAIYPNRMKDKQDLESICDLIEYGNAKFLFKTKTGSLIAQGYLRIVYGDHGPYVEFAQEHIEWENLTCERRGIGYFNKWYTKVDRVMLYEQTKTVSNLANPPEGKFCFNGNRKEGYADYRVGRVYVSPYLVLVSQI